MAGKKRQLDLFKCVATDCWLTKTACVQRFVRAEKSTKNAAGEWMPDAWAQYVLTCRGCPIGKVHASEVAVEAPVRPKNRKPGWKPKRRGK